MSPFGFLLYVNIYERPWIEIPQHNQHEQQAFYCWSKHIRVLLFSSLLRAHFRPQRPRSFWLASRIATSGKVQHRKSAIHGLPVTLRMLRVKFDKSDWLRVQNEFSAHVQKIGPGQRSRFLVLTKRGAASGREWLRAVRLGYVIEINWPRGPGRH